MRYKVFILFVLLLSTLAFFADAQAQSSGDVANRLNRLENEIETLSRAVFRGERPPAPPGGINRSAANAADMEVRIQQLENQIRLLTGQIEEQSFQIRQLRSQFEKLSADTALRLEDLEKTGGGGHAGTGTGSGMPGRANYMASTGPRRSQPTGAQQGMSSSSASSGAGTEKMAGAMKTRQLGTINGGEGATGNYENAFSLLENADYDAAEQAFQSFLSQYPDHPLSVNAKYWLGETHYVRGNYERAARIFAEGYQQYPDSDKAADNLLKLGLSLAAVGNKADACVALRQLEKDFTQGAGPVLRRAQQEMKRLGC